ncbi:predicted protein [Paecilomyces variotii No. 5]|uniref:Xylanolytic transcriptional activator regulatory domain-containing protein n=1 Tax=Byssochlamys spectabilis (strain No. 5 / NBRC 109023) TaxID=1356009 RepID=V5G9Q6_BYSSN|nr:predicted protein [Paecilomyces variotii No. 5]
MSASTISAAQIDKFTLYQENVLREVGRLIDQWRGGLPEELFAPKRGAFNVWLRMKFRDGGSATIRFPCFGAPMFAEEKVRREVSAMHFLERHTISLYRMFFTTAFTEMHMNHLATQRNDAIESETDCRRKYVARCLFPKLTREHQLCRQDSGPCKLFCDDFRPGNFLANAEHHVVGSVDWEFSYAAPVGFAYSPPFWLLLELPEFWSEGLQNWTHHYEQGLEIFLSLLKEREDVGISRGILTEEHRLSNHMRENWESGDFWLNYAARKSWVFDMVYWAKVDKRFFGDGDFKDRLLLLTEEERDCMDGFIQRKLAEKKEHTSALGPPLQDTGLTYGCDEPENLSGTIDRLLTALKQHQAHLAYIKSDSVNADAFFSSQNLVRFVTSFFQHCYNGDSFVHQASFNVNTVSTAVLLAVILLGAMSASPYDAAIAQEYLTAAEYLVFEDTEFCQLLYSEGNPPRSRSNIELLQAAIIVAYLQYACDQVEIKRRIRTQRFPSLVSVVRSLKLTEAINDTLRSEEFVLQNFVDKETLVRSFLAYIYYDASLTDVLDRIISWVFLADTHFVIFYGCAAQFKIFEADFGLPQHDELFDAVDPLDIERILSQIPNRSKNFSLKSTLRLLMDDSPVQIEEILQDNNSLFALFLIIAALQSILFEIFSLRSCITGLELFTPIDCALDRWKLLWDSFHTCHDFPSASRSGYVMRASIEHWWLAKTLMKRRDLVDQEAGCAADSMNTFHNLVKRLMAEDTN